MIPSHKEMMLPILMFMSSRKDVTRKEIYEFVIKHFNIKGDELTQRIPSGILLYISRASWALAYFDGNKDVLNLPESKKPIKKLGRSLYKITEFGKKIAQSKNAKAQFLAWYDKIYNKNRKSNQISQEIEQEKTPNDTITEVFNELKNNLKTQILDEISQKEPSFFEFLVTRLLEKMGYGTGKLTKNGADGGIDGIIDEDELGLSQIYIQAKSWKGNVSRQEIQKFVGAISDKQTKKGVFITTSSFTKEAIIYANNVQSHNVILINGDRLAELMIKYKVGISVRETLEICDIDSDFFSDDKI